ncbi:hypothetical protein [Cellulomonas chengniuliangii]|uniref:Lipoprotein n=1 Tax=Cellulomonas chengniuliangii TaxID=2968084 RepID=A0ABY5L3Q8_9CELL|nr:hypothetical protein [Cellulomonas chengniuliangii]MCC2307113.1 hypothetical protein [Cellulomonas chengniuliangii]MCC2316496.1 hypothetical protein [Cellulomonas chengniuliangii]UUI76090.1 hypothetical protein NP064_04060 [Cellulomonas chengniuliangii]
MTANISRSARPRRAAVAASALAVASLLGACSGQPGAAAVVDGEEISAAELQDAVAEVGPFLQGATPITVLTVLVQTPAVDRVAAENGVAASDADADALLSDIAAQAGMTDLSFGDGARAVARYSLEINALQSLPNAGDVLAQLTEEVASSDVEVSPRYADVTADNQLVAPARDWLVLSQDSAGG